MEQYNLDSPIKRPSECTDHVVSSDTSMLNSIIQDSPIFDPEFHDPLIQIINQLDPQSFMKLSRTCRTMHHFCFSVKGIEVRISSSFLFHIVLVMDNSKPEGASLALVKPKFIGEEACDFPAELIEKLIKMPFRIVVAYVDFDSVQEVTTGQLEALRRYLRRFHRIELKSISLHSGTSDWNTLAEIIPEFGVKQVCIHEHEIVNPIPENVLYFFATNLNVFDYPYYVSDDFILTTTAKNSFFSEAKISVDTFKKLLERFVAGEFSHWKIGRQPLMANKGDRSDPFIDACSEVVKVAQVENVDFIIKDPGVLYFSPRDPRWFYMLMKDGSTGRLLIEPELISFS